MWTAVAPMSVSRDAVGVCLLGDRLYAVGGYDGQVYLNTVETYDPQTNEWTQVCMISILLPSAVCQSEYIQFYSQNECQILHQLSGCLSDGLYIVLV